MWITMEIVIILLCLFLSGFFSGSEIAFFSLSDAKVLALVRKRVRGAKMLYRLKRNPERLLVTILIGNNIVNIGLASFTTVWVTNTFGSQIVGVATGIITLLVLVFGEIFPKSIGTRFAQQIAFLTAGPLYGLMVVLTPFTFVFEWMSRALNNLLKPKKDTSKAVEEEVKALSHLSYKSGLFEEFEHGVIQKIFSLNDTTVKKVMTPISKAVMVKGDMNLSEVSKKIRFKHFSRIPVLNSDETRLSGFLYLRDILLLPQNQWDKRIARLFQRHILSTTERTVLSDLYEDFIDSRTHMAAVYNKDKKLVGIVTIEDILEELLGEIHDETDPMQDG